MMFYDFRRVTGFIVTSVLLLSVLMPISVGAAASGFSARFIHYKTGEDPASQSPAGSILVLGKMIRMETIEGGRAVIRIFKPDDGLIFEIHPDSKTYNELPYTPGITWFSRHEAMRDILQKTGADTIAGQTSDHYTAPLNIAEFWISQELQFPMRSKLGEDVYQVRDLDPQAPDPGLFVPPAGYALGFSYSDLQKRMTVATQNNQEPKPGGSLQPESQTLQQEDDFVFLPSQTDEELKKMAFPLRVYVQPADGGKTNNLEQPLGIIFSQAIHPAFFSFTIEPDPGAWKMKWQDDLRKVTLIHDAPFSDKQVYTLNIEIAGEPEKRIATFTAKDRSPELRLDHDLKTGTIDINKATTYRINRLLNYSEVPKRYRLDKMVKSGTPAFRKALADFFRLNQQARAELLPYFLPSANPHSYWYQVLNRPAGPQSGWNFSLVTPAYARKKLFKLVYVTGSGVKLVIMGPEKYRNMIRLARQLVEEKKMYENFYKLLGRHVPFHGDRELFIYIVPSINNISGDMDEEPLGWCPDLPADPADPDSPYGIPEIFISGSAVSKEYNKELERGLGATLAHEMFHAFQIAFTRQYLPWVTEATAVWAEDFINRSWNTEQIYIADAFEEGLYSLKDLETEDSSTPYGMYLFPLFLTTNRPGEDGIIRQIWEKIESGTWPIRAVKNILGGSYEQIWKEYALATLDETPESGKLPDNPNKWGDGPLVLNTVHEYDESEIGPSGTGGVGVQLDKLSASYHKINNKHQGPEMPAVRFDLRQFRKDETVSLQAVVVYRDGRREYEDWTERDKRVFCLSNPKQNFKEIYIVAACSSDEQTEDRSFMLEIYPDPAVDCYKGSATMTLDVYGQENRNIRKSFGTKTEEGSSSWGQSVTVRLGLELWRQDIPSRLKGVLDSMTTIYPEVDEDRLDIGRDVVEGSVRKPVTYEDPNTGLTVLKYRVTSVQVASDSGRKQLSSSDRVEDSFGLVRSCQTTYSETNQGRGLNKASEEWLSERWFKVEVFVNPDTGVIKWVRLPMVGAVRDIIQKSKTLCTVRYQDKKGFYHYKDERLNSNDTRETEVNLTFDSSSEEKKGQPMDPVWKSEARSKSKASGRGSYTRSLAREWKGQEQSGYIRGKEVTEFRWRLNLENVKSR